MSTIEDLRKFTYDAYISLLKVLDEKYELITCSQVTKTKTPFITIRHDVDGSLESALELAQHENNIDIHSTYVVLYSHKLYNLLEPDSLNNLRKISSLGHEIGLHYDLEAFKSYNIPPYMLLDQQINSLSSLVGKPIKTITRHRNSIKNIADPFAGRPYVEKGTSLLFNSGHPQHFDLIVKDSCREWIDNYVNKLFSFKYNRILLVSHPLYWTKREMTRNECLNRLFDRINKNNKEYHEMWLNAWRMLGR